jgi:LysR family glycine cleavage system transcriptional activator
VVVDAAVQGLGAAVLPWALVEDEVAAGRLAAPSGFVPDGGVLAVIRGRGEPSRSERAVLRWLKEQARAMRT